MQFGRLAFKGHFPRAIRRWKSIITDKSTSVSLDWEKALRRTKRSMSISFQAGELLKAMASYRGAEVELPIDLDDPHWIRSALQHYEDVMQAIERGSDVQDDEDFENNDTAIRRPNAAPPVYIDEDDRPTHRAASPVNGRAWDVIVSRPSDPKRTGLLKEETVHDWVEEHKSLKHWPSMVRSQSAFHVRHTANDSPR